MEQSQVEQELHRHVAASVDRILQEEARRNELTIARVRTITLAFATALDFVFFLNPQPSMGSTGFSPTNAALAAGWLVVAGGVAAILQAGWYQPWLRVALPLLDSVIVFTLFSNIFLTTGENASLVAPLVNVAAVCALLALTGSLRLTRSAAWLTTLAAILIFGTASALASFDPLEAVFTCSLLIGAGFLGMWLADIVRRAVQSEVGRMILTRFLPPGVVEGAHMSLITRPRLVDATVVVTDLRGFTAFAEGQAPGSVLSFLSRVQGALADAVQEHGGTVDKFMGDGMLAVFGVSAEHPDHASRAIRAARAMLQRSRSWEQGNTPVRLGVGVHSGPVVAGCLGSGERLEFTIIGDAVNTASRLEALNKEKGTEILVSGETVDRLGATDEAAGLVSVGDSPIRGKDQRIALFTLRQAD